MIEAYVQPALINRASLVFANIANTEWADGKSTDEMADGDIQARSVSVSAPAADKVNIFGQTFDKETVLAAMKSIGETTNQNITVANLEAKISALGEDKKVELKQALGIEA